MNFPRHVTQHGVRVIDVFHDDEDRHHLLDSTEGSDDLPEFERATHTGRQAGEHDFVAKTEKPIGGT